MNFEKGNENMHDFGQKKSNIDEKFPNRAGKPRVFRRLGRPRCLLCGELVEASNGYYLKDGFPYCKPCMEVIDTDLLIRICETNRKNWLKSMGFSYIDH